MSTDKRIAVVTGANRGIGKEICRQLAEFPDIHVILTARSQEKGQSAVDELKKEGKDCSFLALDMNSEKSIRSFVEAIDSQWGRLDILVNNAGILLDRSIKGLETPAPLIRQTLDTNLIGPVILCQAVIPLMKKNGYGRIVNMSSGMGQMEGMEEGFLAYRLSKVGLNALTQVLANECSEQPILINSMCPGWVHTEMGGAAAPLSVKEGADTATWLATLPDDGPRGGLFRKRQSVPW